MIKAGALQFVDLTIDGSKLIGTTEANYRRAGLAAR
jgi:hypothetical protein